MFSPHEPRLERGWPGRIDGDHVIQLAAQTLQSFFSGGGQAREHSGCALADVELRAPVLHPPSVRIFDGGDFAFANPAAIRGPNDAITAPNDAGTLAYELRPAAVVGAEERVGGVTIMNVLTAPALRGAKARDFALVLGPVVLTPDEDVPALDVDWDDLVAYARRNTHLVPGDVIAADPIATGGVDGGVEVAVEGIGSLRNLILSR
jgi:2-keto-4-pentenoate hydratase/2-oxohepta-3-ene-1,7-dioic acid hydratase in catechol pathway